jgi:hypothetical protein
MLTQKVAPETGTQLAAARVLRKKLKRNLYRVNNDVDFRFVAIPLRRV